MKIRLLPEAERDIEVGADFYELQNPGLGAYFNDCIATDIDSLKTFGGIHEHIVVISDRCRNAFLLPSTTS